MLRYFKLSATILALLGVTSTVGALICKTDASLSLTLAVLSITALALLNIRKE
jgi:hypothetical protein